MWNDGLDEAQSGIKIARRNTNNLRYADDTTLMAESEEELKSLLVKVKEESEKVGLKLNIQKTKIMASSPITSWQTKERKKVKWLSHVQLFATPCAVAYQTSPSMGFSRQEYWSRLPFSSPGDLPNSGIKPRSPTLQSDTLPSEPPGKPSWQINGEVMEIMRDFISLGSKITADGDCSHEIKRRLLLGRKAVTNLDSISRDITCWQRSV